MSNRFVSGGTIGSSGDLPNDTSTENATPLHNAAKSSEWEAVQQELDAERRRREEQRVKSVTGEGERSLYDVLQANKAAKQAAFEEQSKLRNQFRALDDDEIDFLDDVRAAKRAEEERVRRETEEGLKAFRQRQKSDVGAGDDQDAAEGESWGIGRKRKRAKEREVKGVVRRRVSGEQLGESKEEKKGEKEKEEEKKEERLDKKDETSVKKPEKKGLGLVAYGSDSDDD